MPTVIDSLIVTLNLDGEQYKKERAQIQDAFRKHKGELEKNAKDEEAANKKVAESFGQVKREALGLFATLIGANSLKSWTASTVTSMTDINIQARLMGQSAQSVDAFGKMIAKAGGDANAARGSMAGLTRNMEAFKTLGAGAISTDMARSLSFIGGMNPNFSALDIYRKFAQWSQGKNAALVNQVGAGLGLDPGSIFEAQNRGGKGVDSDYQDALKRTIADKDAYDNVQKLLGAWRDLQQVLQKDAEEVLNEVTPALVGFLNVASDIAKHSPDLVKALMGVVTAFVLLKGSAAALGLLGIGSKGAGAAAAGGAGGVGVGGVAAVAAGVGAGVAFPLKSAWDIAHQKNNPVEWRKAHPGEHGIGGFVDWMLGTSLFDSGKGGPPAPTGKPGGAVPAGGSLQDQVKGYFKSLGYSDAAAEGIAVGSTVSEGGKVGAKNPYSTAYGIGQWTKSSGRWDDFRRVIGKDIHGSTLEEQLRFMAWELTHTFAGAGNAVRGAGSAYGAGDAFLRGYERPGAGLAGDLGRLSRALGGRGGFQPASTGASVSVGQINIYAKDGSGAGIAREVKTALRTQILTANANQGLA